MQNSLKNGLLPIVAPADVHAILLATAGAIVKVDLASQTMTVGDGRSFEFPIDAFSKHCLLEGVDELGYILQQEVAIAGFEGRRVGSVNTLA
jgi:3-isopropylmalate/(R)-2-methylmalate dehydratase small subunit